MKKTETVYREILYNAIEKGKKTLTQAETARKLGISLSIVNKAVNNLARIGAVKINKRNFVVIDAKKALYYWASLRNLEKDIVFRTRAEIPVRN